MNFRELGRAPVNENKPAGEDIRYDPAFEALQAEIDSKPSAGSDGTSWKKVADLASNIIGTRSKDVLVASYLAVGLLHTEGVPQGLIDGLTVLRDMMDEYWDKMFPPPNRMRGRIQAIGWWLERTEAFLAGSVDVPPIDATVLQELSSAADALDALLTDKCPDAPSLRKIREFISSLPTETTGGEEAADHPSPSSDVPGEQQQASSSQPIRQPQADASFSSSSLNDQTDADRLLSSVIEKNYLLVDFMLTVPTQEPCWYSLNLLSAWFEIRKLPPATNGRTLIPVPDSQIINSIASMKKAENWGGVLKSSCYTIRRYPFWLDMNRFASEALSMLGENYIGAKQAVEDDTVRFIRRFEGIENFTFSDGTAFADSQTRTWLGSLAGNSAGGPEAMSCRDDFEAKVADEFSRCQDLFKAGRQQEGLSIIQTLLQTGSSVRQRYLWRLSLVSLLNLSGMEKLLLPHICELMKDYDSYRLEEWDPELALHSLKTIWTVLKNQNTPESKSKADDVFERVSRLSPSDAFLLMK